MTKFRIWSCLLLAGAVASGPRSTVAFIVVVHPTTTRRNAGDTIARTTAQPPSRVGATRNLFNFSSSTFAKQLHQHQLHSTKFQKTKTTSSSALWDIQSSAISFFDSVRTPSTLLGGQSIAALFAISNLVQDPKKLSRTEVFLLRLYHIVSLLSLCLSLVTIITSTSASTMLLVGNRYDFSKFQDVFEFLNTDVQYEFLLVRWSFFSSLLLFLVGIANRALLEFRLLAKKRRVAGIFLVCSMGWLISFLLSYINRTLMGPQANFFLLTLDVLKVRTH